MICRPHALCTWIASAFIAMLSVPCMHPNAKSARHSSGRSGAKAGGYEQKSFADRRRDHDGGAAEPVHQAPEHGHAADRARGETEQRDTEPSVVEAEPVLDRGDPARPSAERDAEQQKQQRGRDLAAHHGSRLRLRGGLHRSTSILQVTLHSLSYGRDRPLIAAYGDLLCLAVP